VGCRRVLDTVPVEEDGSAHFTIPANTPVFVQPLDADGQALQTMRSWFTGMPGERVSCIGCHAGMNEAPPSAAAHAAMMPPAGIESTWLAPARGFNFVRESFERIVTSADINAPFHGTWHEIVGEGRGMV